MIFFLFAFGFVGLFLAFNAAALLMIIAAPFRALMWFARRHVARQEAETERQFYRKPKILGGDGN